ncbi:SDR family oxidoreductase [Danxiaibacter flavus]|uniref:SDR family oxidoreductase n=1 Tax=Danxiaibacter flavus TaxID=3049108 RepID=A0ABV3ZCJ5_9BACT|nr:SDR family oxidoreductase [Chitinophagaceae bacterium DXS]
MNLDLSNKTALVCGASQGLGAAVAKELALLGATVIVLARNEDKLKKVVELLDVSKKQRHSYIVADTSKPQDVQEKVKQQLTKTNIIHILVNNTGGPPSGPLLDTPAEELELAFDAHLVTSHLLAQTLVPGMRKAEFGRIVNIVSTSVKQPINGLGISNTVRAAVANWAKTLANEIGHFGITVNNVLPGFTNTDRLAYLFGKQAEANDTSVEEITHKSILQIPAGRLGEASEFGAAVAFLCSPAASYINGVNLPVDGGRTGTL